MAIMCPTKPREIEKNSKEDLMFKMLEKLSDSYYVFHSFSIVDVSNSVLYESETDFIIFHPNKGIISIEAKSGEIKYENGEWKYASGISMKHDGPFNQASRNKWKLINYIQKKNFNKILDKCKFLHAVWFPDVHKKYIDMIDLPSESDIELIITKDDEDELEKALDRIFNIQVSKKVETNLTKKEIDLLLNSILAPSFNLISLSELEKNHREKVFKLMLDEQIALLNYLEEQNNAIINGMAGTGKTIIAIEKAKRHSDNGEQVLFLCYNKNLKDFLKKEYNYENISFYTIDGFACKLCNTKEADYFKLKNRLEKMYLERIFPYQHVIIDEGQDFGKEKLEESEIIDLLKMNVLDDEELKGTFYLFYDKNQMIQSERIPMYIENSDCKLTLYKNCRNTENIAITSSRLLGIEKKPKLFKGSIKGSDTDMYIINENLKKIEVLNKIIDENSNKYNDIVILTCGIEKNSFLFDNCKDGYYEYKDKKILFTTCRKFKGLEADSVVLIDVNKNLFNISNEQLFYVGASRARFKLSIILDMTDEDCKNILKKINKKPTKNPAKILAATYNCKYKEII